MVPLARMTSRCPRPPRCVPAPPESGRRLRSMMSSGARASTISAGTPRTPDGNAVLERPSLVGRAPIPPELKKAIENRLPPPAPSPPCRLSEPENCVIHRLEDPSAITWSGIACARAPWTTAGSHWPTICRPATGAGGWQLRIDPTGAVMVTGRKLPSLFGTSGARAHLIPYVEYASV